MCGSFFPYRAGQLVQRRRISVDPRRLVPVGISHGLLSFRSFGKTLLPETVPLFFAPSPKDNKAPFFSFFSPGEVESQGAVCAADAGTPLTLEHTAILPFFFSPLRACTASVLFLSPTQYTVEPSLFSRSTRRWRAGKYDTFSSTICGVQARRSVACFSPFVVVFARNDSACASCFPRFSKANGSDRRIRVVQGWH